MTSFNTELFFTSSYGTILSKSDGTITGTAPIFTLSSSTGHVRQLVKTGNFVYLSTYNFYPSQGGLWKSDGTATGASLLKSFDTEPTFLFPMGNLLYFSEFSAIDGFELGKSDGTVTGTQKVKVFSQSSQGYFPIPLAVIGDKYYCTADDASGVNSVWVTDGTAANTTAIATIIPANTSAQRDWPFPAQSGNLIFSSERRDTRIRALADGRNTRWHIYG